MLTCEDCGTALNEDVARISEIKIRRRVCRSCRVAVTNPCGDMSASVGVDAKFDPDYLRRYYRTPTDTPRIEREKNLPIMATVLQAALDWTPEEIEALAAHLFEIATATTGASLRRSAMMDSDLFMSYLVSTPPLLKPEDAVRIVGGIT